MQWTCVDMLNIKLYVVTEDDNRNDKAVVSLVCYR